MIIAPNSRAREGEKMKGEVKEECGRIRGKEEEENADPVSNMFHHV